MTAAFEVEERDRPTGPDRALLAWALRYARPHAASLLGCLVLLLGASGLTLAQPYLIKRGIDEVMTPAAGADALARAALLERLWPLVALYVLAVAGAAGLAYAQGLWLGRVGQDIMLAIRRDLLDHLHDLGLAFFDRQPAGRLVTRVTNDVEALNEMYTSVLVNLFRDLFVIGGALYLLFRLDLRLSLVILAFMPVVLATALVFQRFSRRAWRATRRELARINARLAESLSGVRVIQLFGRELRANRDFAAINGAYYDATMRVIHVFAIFGPSLQLLTGLALALIVWLGGLQVLGAAISLGTLYAFTAYLRMLFEPLNGLAQKYNILQAALAAAERIIGLLETEPGIRDAAGAAVPEAFRDEAPALATAAGSGTNGAPSASDMPALAFEDVWFAYDDEDWVLRGLSFTVMPGETVGFVGRTGAGKTTIMSLLPRFYDVQRGRVLVGGRDVRDWPRRALRRHVASVMQDVFLFAGDIEGNITLGDPAVPPARARAAAAEVGATRFVDRLPEGFAEPVVERGQNFSAGEHQLLAFARALAREPRVLLLDEATAHVDTETEEALQTAIRRAARDRTTLIVAHRLATIRDADRIYVMDAGRIVERGTHAELLAEDGIYARLWRLQAAKR